MRLKWDVFLCFLIIFLLQVSCSHSTNGFSVDETIHFSLQGPQGVTKGNTVQFSVILENYPANDQVNWSCSKGSITDRGVYTAPFEQGPAEIAAVRKDNGARQSRSVALWDPPTIQYFLASPQEISVGATSTLTFFGDPNSGTVTPGGMLINSLTPVVVSPTVTTTYKVTIYNQDAASASAEVTVTVK